MNFKEKNKYLRELHAPQHVLSDLELLKQLDPRNDQIPTFEHAPARHAERILYLLLDIATPEDIRNNRRDAELKAEEAERKAAEEAERKAAEENSELETELEEEKKSTIPVKTETSAKTAAPSSKKKPSTRTSTGKGSKTKTSK